MKRVLLVLLAVIMCVALSSCGDKAPTEPKATATPHPTTDVTFHQLSFKVTGTGFKSESISNLAPSEWVKYRFASSPIRDLNAYACEEYLVSRYLNDQDAVKETITLNGQAFTKCTYTETVTQEDTKLPPTYRYNYVYIIKGTQCWYMVTYTETVNTGDTTYLSFLPQFEESLKYDPNAQF
ncbi:MAG: hypothetical protein IKS78_02905 [Clostridia bacterium]|nr:hypothetical protein [Clostridia bacterium]MBR5985418.1 hypothetical protein [Clostridia bacterium]MBR6008974.1 hypothetical protein [Clostridia bacterium]